VYKSFSVLKWIEDNASQLKPPISNKIIVQDDDFIVMAVGGPNQRTDFHVDPYAELFYQHVGGMTLRILDTTTQSIQNLEIPEGHMFLLPARVPHSPQRPKGSLGLVVEIQRKEADRDHLQWFCELCCTQLYDYELCVDDIETAFIDGVESFYRDENNQKCKNCGWMMPKRPWTPLFD
jgi:3-hydroxyanthranilate 3,4-dioxygenase